MTVPSRLQGLILAVHPYSRGFGWAIFESAIAPADWGIVETKNDRNARCLERVEKIMSQYEPSVLVLEQFDRRPSRRSARVKKLGMALSHLAVNRGIALAIYSRAAIRTYFKSVGGASRYEIAKIISLHIHVFRKRMPKSRRAWEGEDCRQSLFDAAALAMTHLGVTGNRPLSV